MALQLPKVDHSRTACALCFMFFECGPLNERDGVTFKAHLRDAHGWVPN